MKILFLTAIGVFIIQLSFAQSTMTPTEKVLTDTICNCLSRTDMSKIANKQEALTAFTTCFAKRMDLLMKVAEEKKVDPTDKVAMRQIGIDLGKNLFAQNCAAFSTLSVKMAGNESADEDDNQGHSEGTFKRIDLKGVNYVVIAEGGSERSFVWLRQFPGSERFMTSPLKYAGKKVKIKWQAMEIYFPLNKAYYQVKEILSIDFL